MVIIDIPDDRLPDGFASMERHDQLRLLGILLWNEAAVEYASTPRERPCSGILANEARAQKRCSIAFS